MKLGTAVSYEGRPAVIGTAPKVGATGEEMIGIRFTDMPKLEQDPRMPGLMRPPAGSWKIVPVNAVVQVH